MIERDDLDRLFDALPEAPPPPPFERVAARLAASGAEVEGVGARLRLLKRRLVVSAAAAAILVAAGLVFLTMRPRSSSHPDSVVRRPVEVATLSGTVRVRRGDREIALADAREDDVVEATSPARVRIGSRATAVLSTGTALVLDGTSDLRLAGGTAGFDVPHAAGAPAFTVRAGERRIVDRGTRFAVSVRLGSASAAEAVGVAVLEGAVEVDGVRVEAGRGASVTAAGTEGATPTPLSRPEATLSIADPDVAVGGAVTLGIHLVNRSPFPCPWPVTDDVSVPLLLEVTDPARTARTLRVTRDAVVVEGTPEPFLEGGLSAPSHVLTVRFAALFPAPGTYRLRAVWPADGNVPETASPPLLVKAR